MCKGVKEGIDVSFLNILNKKRFERGLYYYKNNKKFIILTNERFLKTDGNKISKEIYLNKIEYINNIDKGIFKSNILEIVDNNYNIVKFGIYSKKVCDIFYKLIKNLVS